jgi:ferredoxin-NADP reductase
MVNTMDYTVSILEIYQVTHDVKCFRVEKPSGFQFVPGQATDVSINKPGLKEDLRPFTFTGLNEDSYLEFTIKRYADHHGITDKLHQLQTGDQLIIRDAWGAIEYKGPGYFIAGGAGITPFIAILRSLYKKQQTGGNRLIFSNKTSADIIYQEELKKILGDHVLFLLSREKAAGYLSGRPDEQFIKKNITDFKRHFYVCGPDEMVSDLTNVLEKAGAETDSLVFEK